MMKLNQGVKRKTEREKRSEGFRERQQMVFFFQVSGSPCPVERAPPQTSAGLWRANPIQYLLRARSQFLRESHGQNCNGALGGA